MLLGVNFRSTMDKNGENCSCLDVVVNPAVGTECNNDKTGEVREDVRILLILALPFDSEKKGHLFRQTSDYYLYPVLLCKFFIFAQDRMPTSLFCAH